MRQNVVISLACVLTAIFFLPGCGGGKYADVEQASNQWTNTIEEFTAALDKATGAPAVAKAINQFADKMEKLAPTMEKLTEKYPELKNEQNLPEPLKKVLTRMEEAGKKMMGAMMKAAPYMADPEVQKAQQRLESLKMD
jgi:DNA polymerase I-like protein with 3'-5' exonuclease and polymerase domains